MINDENQIKIQVLTPSGINSGGIVMYIEKKYFVIYNEDKKRHVIYKFIEEGLINNRMKPIFNKIPSKEFIVDVQDYLRLYKITDVVCSSYSFPDEIDLNAVNFIVVRDMESKGKYYMCHAYQTQDDEPKLDLPQVKISCVLEDGGKPTDLMKAELYYNPFHHMKTAVSRWYVPFTDERDPKDPAVIRVSDDNKERIELLSESKFKDLLASPVFGFKREMNIKPETGKDYRVAYTRLGKINPYNEIFKEIAVSRDRGEMDIRGDILIYKMKDGEPVGIPSDELEEVMKLLGN